MNDNLIMNIPSTRDQPLCLHYMRKWVDSSHNTIHIDVTAIKGVSSRRAGASTVGGGRLDTPLLLYIMGKQNLLFLNNAIASICNIIKLAYTATNPGD
jgi:hypothetical protein